MNYSQTIIDQVSELAANLTPPGDIAVLLDLDPDELNVELSLKDSPLRRAYLKAKATTALMLRRQEIDLARVGSPLAVQMAGTYFREMNSSEDF